MLTPPGDRPEAPPQVAAAIPARAEDRAAASSGAHRSERRPATKLVYVVEDQPTLSELYTTILESSGYDVRTFQNRESAWQTFLGASRRPDLLITDYLGFPITAAELISRFRRVKPSLKVLMVSGYPTTELPQDELRRLDGFLAKPHRPEQLVEHVTLVLSRRVKHAPDQRPKQVQSTVG